MNPTSWSVMTRDHVFVYVRGILVMKTYRDRKQPSHVW